MFRNGIHNTQRQQHDKTKNQQQHKTTAIKTKSDENQKHKLL
jgi:hypothetical protein